MVFSLILTLALMPAQQIGAADHGDGPGVGVDRSADLNDGFLFLDPNDNTRVVMILTVNGFIVPGEAVNFGVFDHNLRYRFEIESNGNATPDGLIDVTFLGEGHVGRDAADRDRQIDLLPDLHRSDHQSQSERYPAGACDHDRSEHGHHILRGSA